MQGAAATTAPRESQHAAQKRASIREPGTALANTEPCLNHRWGLGIVIVEEGLRNFKFPRHSSISSKVRALTATTRPCQ